MTYHFRLDALFEGPLDLLLSLIEKERLDITRVSLAKVADQYLEYLSREESISLENLSSFLSVAARLILIKSRALLPVLEWAGEDEEAADDLESRLKLYKLFRDASHKLDMLFLDAAPAHGRESFLGAQAVFYPPEGLSAADLRKHFIDVLGEIPVIEKLPEEELRTIITLEEKLRDFQTILAARQEHSFRTLTESASDRVEVIVSFLALLELVKQRFVLVEQMQFGSDIRIQRL